jgi:acyl-CoA thioesterase FadM
MTVSADPSTPEIDGAWRFRHVTDAPDEGHGLGFHVSNLGIARVLFDSRNRYFDSLPIEGGMWAAPVTPLIREILLRYEAEVATGARLEGTLAITSRSRRSFVMEESLTDITDPHAPRLIASGHSVHVTVDLAARTAIEIPDWLLQVFEDFQGAPIPLRR